MPCIDPAPVARCLAWGLVLATGLLGACRHAAPPALPQPPAAPVATAPGTASPPPRLPGQATAPAAPPAAPPRALAPMRPARHWDDFRRLAAERIVDANPAGSYLGPVPEPLLAIPVLEVELHADGSVRRIQVTRRPTQALDTVQLAIDAVQRAAPFAPVGHLPRPWKFTEVFLFDEQRRFKPRSLD